FREDSLPAATVRLPRRGGDLFVSSNARSPTASGLQADLNAAANVGLKVLMHPDYEGAWWYVPVDPANGEPMKDRVKGCSLWEESKALFTPAAASENGKKVKRAKTIVYAWNPLHGGSQGWMPTAEYKRQVERQVANNLI